MLKDYRSLFVVLIFLLFSFTSHAQLVLNEMLVNPPGTDNPFEYIEIRGTPGSTINQIFLCVFEGDSASAGNCDLSIPLQDITLGSNGLLFIGTTIGYPELPNETSVINDLNFAIPGSYLENGSTTFTLIFSTTNIEEDFDYDANDDGILELPDGAIILDAVGWSGGNIFAKVYGGVELTQSSGRPDAAIRFYEDLTPFSKPAWYNGDLVDLINFDLSKTSSNFPFGEETGMTPGDHNIPNNGVGFSEISETSFLLYPNPALNYIDIPANADIDFFNIYALNGQLIKSKPTNPSTRISIEDIPSGMYILELKNGQKTLSNQRLLIK